MTKPIVKPLTPKSNCAFVTGLPRTRTAWFAALINAHKNPQYWKTDYEGYHELTTKAKNQEEYEEWLNSSAGIGVDCGSVIHYIPLSPLLVIERPNYSVADALAKLPLYDGVPIIALRDAVVKMHIAINHLVHQVTGELVAMGRTPSDYVKIVSYKDLDKTDVVMECLEFLGIEPDQVVIEYMQEFNIQAQYLNTITLEEFNAMGARIGSNYQLKHYRELINTPVPQTKH